MMSRAYDLMQGRNVNRNNMEDGVIREKKQSADQLDYKKHMVNGDLKKKRVNLMEAVMLLCLKNETGYPSFWNNSISLGLRGCILMELALRERIDLEEPSMERKSLHMRKVIIKNWVSTGDYLLDKALKLIKVANPPETVQSWIEYFNGVTWNPLKIKYKLLNVQERLIENLVKKGVLTTETQNFLLFNMTTHPLIRNDVKLRLVKMVQDTILSKWINDPHKINKGFLALLLMAQASKALESVFRSLNDKDYELATKRLRELSHLDFEFESMKGSTNDVIWAVFAYFYK